MSGAIVAIGGAEFAMRPENEALHDYVLEQVRSDSAPRICLLPTASGDPHDQIVAFHAAMERRGCFASAISLFRLGVGPVDVAEHLLEQDVIYVTGGSMVNLLALWREHELDRIMEAAHERGIVLCGFSAGSMCWFEQGISRGGGAPGPVAGLGLLAGSNCVHYGQDPDRRATYRALVAAGGVSPGLALDDHAAALFHDGEIAETVRATEAAAAYRVEPTGDGEAVDRELESRLLPAPRTIAEIGIEEMRERRRQRAGKPRLGRRRQA